MSTPVTIASGFTKYPPLMIRLCNVSYLGMRAIPDAVKNLGLEVVWGPAELVSIVDVAYSLMFVARDPATDEYTVVVRGTNFDSLESWIKEDFQVGETRPFQSLVPGAPADALISLGTYDGITDLLRLTDPATQLGVEIFLRGARPSRLYVTGHSLGGTLTPPLFAYLASVLGGAPTMAPFSFAGLTSGNAAFANYFATLVGSGLPWRFYNTLDIAPLLWWSQSAVENIYAGHGLHWGFPEDDFLERKFREAAPVGYTQPKGGQALPGTFDEDWLKRHSWMDQALQQHHVATYQTLIDAAFPASPAAAHEAADPV
jgi:hypothetical protein